MNFYCELVHLARIAMSGRRQDVQLYISKLSRKVRGDHPKLADDLDALLTEAPTRDAPLRSDAIAALPVDTNSRLQLARTENPVILDVEPIWSEAVSAALSQVIQEREKTHILAKAGLHPAKTALFTGPPGVGKTLAARWIASKLALPMLTLDLSAVMSSFLGKTGVNVRHVLDYAKSVKCVLLLDELDAVAKRRDDDAEVGELKRLVTVLLQEIDDWPPTGLLLAATNHPGLLDPAVWRRFDLVVDFPMPNESQVLQAVEKILDTTQAARQSVEIVSSAMSGLSFAEIEKALRRAHRESVLASSPIDDALRHVTRQRLKAAPRAVRKQVGAKLKEQGLSDRQVHEWVGVHRDTLRKSREKNS